MDCTTCGVTVADEKALKTHLRLECPQTCPDCGRTPLHGTAGLGLHQRQQCPERVLGPGPRTNIDDADKGEIIGDDEPPAPRRRTPSYRIDSAPPAAMPDSVRDPDSAVFNVIHAWYAYVGTPDITGIATTGLPVDILHSAPSWQSHEVQSQIDQGHILLTPIDAYGQKLRGSPYVHVMPPDRRAFNGLKTRWEAILEQEIDIETDLLEQAERDLARSTDRTDRANARQRVIIFSRRVQQMQALNIERVWEFLVREHELSRAVARSQTQVLDDRIDERVEVMLERMHDMDLVPA